MKRFLSADLIAGVGAGAWAVVAVTALPELATLVAPQVAGAFAVVALGRWYATHRKAAKAAKESASGE